MQGRSQEGAAGTMHPVPAFIKVPNDSFFFTFEREN